MYVMNYEFNNPKKIIVIGDIHGDIKRLKNILFDANIINKNLEWISLDTIVVQLGDQIDSLNREDNVKEWEVIKDIEVIYFTDFLDNIARSKNSLFISLIGNHEFMNVLGDFSYVSGNSNFAGRNKFFNSNGPIRQILYNRPLIIKIDNALFSHSKLLKEHYEILKKYNKNIFYINELWRKFLLDELNDDIDKELFKNLILNNGIFFNRIHDNNASFLKDINIKYHFIGHSIINDTISLIDDTYFYCDIGISRSFNTIIYQYIEILDNTLMIKSLNDYNHQDNKNT